MAYAAAGDQKAAKLVWRDDDSDDVFDLLVKSRTRRRLMRSIIALFLRAHMFLAPRGPWRTWHQGDQKAAKLVWRDDKLVK